MSFLKPMSFAISLCLPHLPIAITQNLVQLVILRVSSNQVVP